MKKKFILTAGILLVACTCVFSQTVYKNYIDGEVYIKLKKEVPFTFDTLRRDVDINTKLPFLYSLLSKYNIIKAEASFYFSKSDVLRRTFKLKFSNIKLVDKFIHELQVLNVIEYAEKIPLNKIVYTPNDLYFSDSSYNGQYGLYKIDAKDAWNVTRGDRNIAIAIVDNGEQVNHPDLSANVVNERDVADNDNDASPPSAIGDWFHGTHTSGTACAVTNNSTGVASIGFNCGLIAVKAEPNSDDSGKYVNDGFAGISWAVENGASIISCSWGNYGYSATNQNIITDAYNNNVVVVAAAGNDHAKDSLFYPAAYDHVISVAASDINDAKADFSNYGSWIDVTAPGVYVLSTFPSSNYGYSNGTSMATPLVAGLCGLIRSVNPSLNVDQVINVIESTCDDINAENPAYNGLLGYGRINAYKAVESALQCVSSIDLGSGNYTVPKTESSGSITSENTISSGAAVILDAATTVDLLPGFHAYNGSSFDAYIDGCSGNKAFDSYVKNKTISRKITVDTIAVNNARSEAQLFNVYPNPTSSVIHLDFTTDLNESNAVIQVFNMEMQKVQELSLGDLIKGRQNKTVDLSKQASGVYYIIIPLSNKKLTAKVSVIK